MNNIEKLFGEYSDCIYRFCCNISDNLYEAEDLFQDTFVKVMEIEKKVMAAKNQKGYLIGIIVHLDKNNRRKKARHKRIAPQAQSFDQDSDILEAVATDEKSVEERLVEKEQLALVRQNILKLDGKYRIVASLYYGEAMAVKDIASTLNLPEGTVKSRLHRVREILKDGLEVFDDE